MQSSIWSALKYYPPQLKDSKSHHVFAPLPKPSKSFIKEKLAFTTANCQDKSEKTACEQLYDLRRRACEPLLEEYKEICKEINWHIDQNCREKKGWLNIAFEVAGTPGGASYIS